MHNFETDELLSLRHHANRWLEPYSLRIKSSNLYYTLDDCNGHPIDAAPLTEFGLVYLMKSGAMSAQDPYRELPPQFWTGG